MSKTILTWGVALVVVAALGCGDGAGGVKTAPVSGTVTLDGKPLPGAVVNFFNEEGNFLGSGTTDDQGKYQLVQGAAVGSNKVWITTKTPGDVGGEVEIDPDDPDPTMDSVQQEAAAEAGGDKKKDDDEGEKVPSKFNSAETTILTFNVPDGGSNSANFALKSK